jgi:ABC-type uncharacterized transport system permease subunit
MKSNMNIDMTANDHALDRKLGKIGWGLSLIWVGIAIMGNAGWGLGLIGLGAIVLGCHALRKYYRLGIDWFGIVFGSSILLIGLKQFLSIRFGDGNMLPILSIVLGSFFLLSVLRKQKSDSLG